MAGKKKEQLDVATRKAGYFRDILGLEPTDFDRVQNEITTERERTLQFLKEVAGDRQATIIFELREFISVEQIRAGVSHAFFVTVEPQSRKDNPDWAWYYILIGENIAKQIKKDLASIGLERCRFKICSKGG